MACILQPKCNFLHGFFRCHLPVETVDVEVRITWMQGTHTFRRDRTCQLIKCNQWNTRLCPHPTIIKKMKTYLELEGKLGPKPQSQSNQFRPPQPDTNPQKEKNLKWQRKEKRLIPTQKYKVKVVTRPNKETMHPPQTNTQAPVNSWNPKAINIREQPPTIKKMLLFMLVLLGQRQGKYLAIILNWGKSSPFPLQTTLWLPQILNCL